MTGKKSCLTDAMFSDYTVPELSITRYGRSALKIILTLSYLCGRNFRFLRMQVPTNCVIHCDLSEYVNSWACPRWTAMILGSSTARASNYLFRMFKSDLGLSVARSSLEYESL